jgi:electron transport complex protein RnfG
MNNDTASQPRQVKSWQMIGTLGGVCMTAGLLVVLVFQSTYARIQQNRRIAIERAVFEVLPGAVQRVSYVAMPEGPRQLDDGEEPGGVTIYAGYDEAGELVGIALPAAAQGYQDVVRVLYGYDPAREAIIGMTVLESKETPGLGDKIAKDPMFLANFESLDVRLDRAAAALLHPIEYVKKGAKKHAWQIDGITGATISSKAVARMLDESARKFLPYLVRHASQFATGEQS